MGPRKRPASSRFPLWTAGIAAFVVTLLIVQRLQQESIQPEEGAKEAKTPTTPKKQTAAELDVNGFKERLNALRSKVEELQSGFEENERETEKQRLEMERLREEREREERDEEERRQREKKQREEEERKEKERKEKERKLKEEQERLDKQKKEKERLEKERQEKDRQEKERLEKEKLQQQKDAAKPKSESSGERERERKRPADDETVGKVLQPISKSFCEENNYLKTPSVPYRVKEGAIFTPIHGNELTRLRCVMGFGEIVNSSAIGGATATKVKLTFSTGDQGVAKIVAWQDRKPNTHNQAGNKYGGRSTVVPGITRIQGWEDYLGYYAMHALGYGYLRMPTVGRVFNGEAELAQLSPDYAKSYWWAMVEILQWRDDLLCNIYEERNLGAWRTKSWYQGEVLRHLYEVTEPPEKYIPHLARFTTNHVLSYLVDDEDTMNPSNQCGFLVDPQQPPDHRDVASMYWVLLDQGLAFRSLGLVRVPTTGQIRNVPPWYIRSIERGNTDRSGWVVYYRCPYVMYLSNCAESVPDYEVGIHNSRKMCKPTEESVQSCESGEREFVCMFDRRLYERLKAYYIEGFRGEREMPPKDREALYAHPNFQSLISALSLSFSTDPLYPDVFPFSLYMYVGPTYELTVEILAEHLAERIRYVVDTIETCVEKHGESAVLDTIYESPFWDKSVVRPN